MDDRWTERRLLLIPDGMLAVTPNGPVAITISPDARHAAAFAALRPHGGPFALVRDEPRGEKIQGELSRPAWTFDGGRFACVLRGADGRMRAVVDEAPSPSFAEIVSPVCFSPAGSSFSYAARERDRYFVIVDHSPIHEETFAGTAEAMLRARPPRWLEPPAAPAGPRRGDGDAVLRRLNAGDAVETPAGSARLEFDMRGNALALRVGARAVELQRPAPSVLDAFAWDCAGHWGALLKRGARGTALVIDGQERENRAPAPVLFAPPGAAALVYSERRATGLFVVVGSRVAGPFLWLGDVELSTDGRAVAFPALEGRSVRWVVVAVAV